MNKRMSKNFNLEFNKEKFAEIIRGKDGSGI